MARYPPVSTRFLVCATRGTLVAVPPSMGTTTNSETSTATATKEAFKKGFVKWVRFCDAPSDPGELAGWNCAAEMNESGGARPAVQDAEEAWQIHTRATSLDITTEQAFDHEGWSNLGSGLRGDGFNLAAAVRVYKRLTFVLGSGQSLTVWGKK